MAVCGAAATLLAASCAGAKQSDEYPAITNPPTVTPGATVNVVATTTQAADFARVVGGDRVSVVGLVKPGIDPHLYAATPEDVRSVARADLLVVNGVGLDQFVRRTLREAGKGKPVALLSRGVPLRMGGAGQRQADPHFWYDPRNAKIAVETVAAALAAVDPAGESTYRANRDAYLVQLDAADARVQAQIATIPQERRKLVTNHDSFAYYTARYGLEYVGAVIPSLETNAAPSAKQISDLIRLIQRQQVPAIFADAVVNPKLEEQIARETGVQVVATLCADSLTAPGGACDSYLQWLEHDTKVIVDALR